MFGRLAGPSHRRCGYVSGRAARMLLPTTITYALG
ncbi:hypothetical protein FHR38_004009 [Micromonospora polyrhachis]|uniref:Uncharacterized protein n=1 Tax=Micromonospora polyrhachis TaxID=1282883 RepID=A0A7W7SSY6_9ACTN|nr:hypothetical protein [Micromonospora polyrhachis]